MSDIGTHKQKVDQDRYNGGYESTYSKPKSKKPGKTVYVCRGSKLVPKEEERSNIIEFPTPPPTDVYEHMQKVRDYIINQYAAPLG
jgi:hypothetical protein